MQAAVGTGVRVATEVRDASVWINGVIVNPLLRERNFRKISFLVDTGADNTTILQGAAKRLRIDFASLEKHPTGTMGISGQQDVYVMENTSLVLPGEQGGSFILRNIDMNVLRPDPGGENLPAFGLFGTDLLSGFRFEYDLPKATLETKGAI